VCLIFFDEPLNLTDLIAVETAAVFESNGVKPELGNTCVTLNMDVGWFISITGIEKETIWTDAKHRWHKTKIRPCCLSVNLERHTVQPTMRLNSVVSFTASASNTVLRSRSQVSPAFSTAERTGGVCRLNARHISD